MRRVAAVFVIAAFVAGCLHAPRTELSDDIPSRCILSARLHSGHIMSCKASKACPASEISEANSVRGEAAQFCAGNPETNPQNMKVIDGIIARQRAVGGAK